MQEKYLSIWLKLHLHTKNELEFGIRDPFGSSVSEWVNLIQSHQFICLLVPVTSWLLLGSGEDQRC